MFRCNCSTGTVARYLFSVKVSQGGRSCSPRLEKRSLSHHPVCAKRMAQGFRCLRAAIRLLALNLASIFEKLLAQKLCLPAACFLQPNIIVTIVPKPLQKKAPDIMPTPIRTESNLLHAVPIRQSPLVLPSNFPAASAVTPAVTFPPLRYANLPPSERQSLPQELASFVRKSPFGNSQPHFPEQCHYHKSVSYT